MSLESAERKAIACEKELSDLREEAPFLQIEHIRNMIDLARKKGDKIREKALINMLGKEYDRTQNSRLRGAFGKPISNPVSRVSPPARDGELQVVYEGKVDTEKFCSDSIVKRNTAGNASPFAQGDLLDALGFMGEVCCNKNSQ